MWLMSCRRQGMLTQGPTPDPNCKLIISPFLTSPHLLDCLIYTRKAMSTVLLLQLNRGLGYVGVGWFILGCWWGDRDGHHLIVLFFSSHLVFSYFFVFCCLRFSFPLFRWLEHYAVVSVSLFFLYFLFLWSL